MNLPNRITLIRVCFIPAYMFFILNTKIPYHEWIAAALFGLASLTDFLDGYISRKYDLVTTFGKFIDPLADKLLTSAAFICMVELGKVSSWIAFIIIAREFAVTGLRIIANSEGIVIAASKLGKTKTVTQIIAIILLTLNNFPFSYIHFPADRIMLYVATVMTLISGIDYFMKSKHLLKME